MAASSVIDKKKELTDRELLFCHEYIACHFKCVDAYVRAGYGTGNRHSDRCNASAMLRRPKIQEKIRDLMTTHMDKLGVKIADVIKELTILGFRDIRDYVDQGEDGVVSIANINEIGEQSKAISKLKCRKDVIGTNGEQIKCYDMEIDMESKIKPLEILARYTGALEDTVRLTGDVQVSHDVDLSGLSDDELQKLLELTRKAKKNEDSEKST